MITVHHLNNSRSQRVLWLLEELGCEYEVRRYERDRRMMLAPPALLAVHPLGKSPVVTDGAFTLAETGAIVDYLLSTYGHGRLEPARDAPDWWDYRYWMHYAEGSAMPPLVMKLIFMSLERRVPWPLARSPRRIAAAVQASYIDPQLERHKDLWAAALEPTGWFAGAAFTAADIMMSFPVEAARARSPFGPGRPTLPAFLARIHRAPGVCARARPWRPYAFSAAPASAD